MKMILSPPWWKDPESVVSITRKNGQRNTTNLSQDIHLVAKLILAFKS